MSVPRHMVQKSGKGMVKRMSSRIAAVKTGCPTSKIRRKRSNDAASCSRPCKRKRKKAGATVRKRIRRESGSDLRPLIEALSASIQGLTASTASIVTFVNQIRNDVNVLQNQTSGASGAINVLETRVAGLRTPEQSLHPLLQARIGTAVTIETPAGTVVGTLVAVGDDYIEILESSGTTAIVRITSIISFV